ncbi:MAG TPA: T9SS type A sorting domain-containing protein, partial [Tenuifilaceae bacterium]|nr:T9SS type A sorting domain-containing protein [Tenuifilaceae bacterium]
NYYSFDDGSAEMGYGLFGEGTIGATVAQKFYNYKADTLKGVMIYFNRTYNDANDKPFRLMVWSDDNGKPGNIIYQKNSVRPKFTDSLNKFSIYRIEPLVIPAGNFYIGWMQENQDMLNVGFDMNIDNKSRLFYNMYGDWENTQKEGTLMIRPILGKMHQIPTNVTPIPTNQNITIYPNPAKDNISIKVDNDAEIATIQIFNSVGNIVLSQNYTYQEPINIQSIPTGFYIVKVCPKKGKCITSKLLIVR